MNVADSPAGLPGGPVDLDAVAAAAAGPWQPRIAASFNGFDAKVARFEGEFVWHVHEDVDEFFLVLDGELTILLRDDDGTERAVELAPHTVYVVPRGVEHKPVAPGGASVLMVEPSGTVNVGDRHDVLTEGIDATTGEPLGR
jgi:mannose-6-phosphate isomerase-like protein (cupin superfamily)